MPIEWKLNAGTLLHLLVLIGTLIGLWVKLRVQFAMVQRELKQFEEDRKEMKEAFTAMAATVRKLELGQERMGVSIDNLTDRINHRRGSS